MALLATSLPDGIMVKTFEDRMVRFISFLLNWTDPQSVQIHLKAPDISIILKHVASSYCLDGSALPQSERQPPLEYLNMSSFLLGPRTCFQR